MKKLAIIGTGISGLGVAYLLHKDYDITVYEQEPRLGGHARTIDVPTQNGNIAVDTGFIVFNYRNYPHLTGLFKHLDVPVKKSDMSLGLSLEHGAFEWGCRDMNGIFAQRSNIVKPRFWRMLRDITRFNKQAVSFTKQHPDITLLQLLDMLHMGQDFRNRFLLPTAGAIWSSSPDQITEFPASSFINFFDNHGLLTINDQPEWYTVDGGSREYVARLAAPFADRIRLACPVASIDRSHDHVMITSENGQQDQYDGVIFATHSDQALRLLQDASPEETATLGNIPYQNNRAYVHTDPSYMPKRKACWSSWNYLCDDAVDERARITVTYWINRLQSIDPSTPIFVTLNPPVPPDKQFILDETMFEHPVYDADMVKAQQKMSALQGKQRTWYCGAYLHHGFHEDGLQSAVNVATSLGCDIPWTQ